MPENNHIIQYPKEYSTCTGCHSCQLVCVLTHDGVAGLEQGRIHCEMGKVNEMLHTVYACQQCADHPCYEAEDIGRHNAIDKVIGMALRDDVDLHTSILYTTGRIPVDMARKCIMAGIPVMVSKEAPTVESVLLSKRYGLSLICNVKKDTMYIFAE